jgi:PadR family transcriptional regulator, regulatory protein AphA
VSAAKHALLGLLVDRPAYGYELANRLAELLGPTWAINPGQVSHTLRALQKQGMITPVAEAPTDGKGRQVMAITQKGIDAVERWWLQDPARAVPLARRPLLVKLALARPERLQAALRQIEVYRRGCAEHLNEIARQHDAVPEGPPVRTDRVLLRLGLRGDMVQLKAELEWARDAHDVVSWLLYRDSMRPGTHGADTQRAHEEREAQRRLFDRMAARHLQAAADMQAEGEDHAAP